MEPVYSTNYYVEIVLFTIIAITCLSFSIVQIMLIKEKYKSIRSTQKTLICATIVHLSFFLMACVALFNHTYPSTDTCLCHNMAHFVSLFYDIGKWSMWYFFVCRAELAQGILPILPDIAFKKFIPFNLVSSFIFTFCCQVTLLVYDCPNPDDIIDSHCIWISWPFWMSIMGIAFELMNTMCYTFLFFYPLWKVNQGTECDYETHNVTEDLFKRQLIWNGAFTSIATISTLILVVAVGIGYLNIWWIFQGGDIFVNSICCFCMVRQNIRFVAAKCGCYNQKDVDMMTATTKGSSNLSNKSSVESPSAKSETDADSVISTEDRSNI